MPTITKDSLLTLEAYAKARAELRRAAIKQKKTRKVFIGDNILLTPHYYIRNRIIECK